MRAAPVRATAAMPEFMVIDASDVRYPTPRARFRANDAKRTNGAGDLGFEATPTRRRLFAALEKQFAESAQLEAGIRVNLASLRLRE